MEERQVIQHLPDVGRSLYPPLCAPSSVVQLCGTRHKSSQPAPEGACFVLHFHPVAGIVAAGRLLIRVSVSRQRPLEPLGPRRHFDLPGQDLPRCDRPSVILCVGIVSRCNDGTLKRDAAEKSLAAAIGIDCGNRCHIPPRPCARRARQPRLYRLPIARFLPERMPLRPHEY